MMDPMDMKDGKMKVVMLVKLHVHGKKMEMNLKWARWWVWKGDELNGMNAS